MDVSEQIDAFGAPGRGPHDGTCCLVQSGSPSEVITVDRGEDRLQGELETDGDVVQLIRSGTTTRDRRIEVQQDAGAVGIRQRRNQHVQRPPTLGVIHVHDGRHIPVAAKGLLKVGVHLLLRQEHELPISGAFAEDLANVVERVALACAGSLVRSAASERHELEQPVCSEHLYGTDAETGPTRGVVSDPAQLGPHPGATPAALSGTVRGRQQVSVAGHVVPLSLEGSKLRALTVRSAQLRCAGVPCW